MKRIGSLFGGSLLCAMYVPTAAAAPQFFFSETVYLSVADSPFSLPANLPTILVLEDFEDGAVNISGLSISGGFVSTNPRENIDSVDADDGTLDGANTGANGNSYWVILNSAADVHFDATLTGLLTTHAGLVWTDGGNNNVPEGLSGEYQFEAFDLAGLSLGSIAHTVGDGNFTGQTAEDRFFGVINPEGLSRVRITYLDAPATPYFEFDHVQFGGELITPVPLPPAVALLASGLLFGVAAARRMAPLA